MNQIAFVICFQAIDPLFEHEQGAWAGLCEVLEPVRVDKIPVTSLFTLSQLHPLDYDRSLRS